MFVISVVRDFALYNRLVKENCFLSEAQFVAFDNLNENKTISARYNSFLEAYDYSKPQWLIFCHEDWELKENLAEKLSLLDKNAIYGPTGRFDNMAGLKENQNIGQIINSDKNGQNAENVGLYCDVLTKVGTLDCQCLIVHSSLVEKFRLRFDEKLSFDLYVEDFCINARENYNIPTYILQINCQHYSRGTLQPRFFKQYSYLCKKWKKSKNFYVTTCSQKPIGSTTFSVRSIILLQIIKRFLYTKKIKKNGKVIIKICKIPLPSQLFRF